ncbi:MAG: NADH-quinone oxidoreductase subunit C [SAR202 cluster bacterium]|nr:NADH-quinone oxidoreductase subunit C [SAR202 cluster bacterium]
MTALIPGERIASMIASIVPGAVAAQDRGAAWIRAETWPAVARGLRDGEETDFKFLSAVTGVDYIDHYEVVYHLTSFRLNHRAVVKVRCGEGREEPAVPSCVPVWRGADLQEREVYDLMGIRFDGHPNLKRVMLWEGFPGHPHRKDFLR